jgi:hypothetical protein
MNSKIANSPRTIFHGWWVVLSLFLSDFMLFGGGLYSFILMIPILTEEFHWSRAATGGLVSTFWLAAPISLFGGFYSSARDRAECSRRRLGRTVDRVPNPGQRLIARRLVWIQ